MSNQSQKKKKKESDFSLRKNVNSTLNWNLEYAI